MKGLMCPVKLKFNQSKIISCLNQQRIVFFLNDYKSYVEANYKHQNKDKRKNSPHYIHLTKPVLFA